MILDKIEYFKNNFWENLIILLNSYKLSQFEHYKHIYATYYEKFSNY